MSTFGDEDDRVEVVSAPEVARPDPSLRTKRSTIVGILFLATVFLLLMVGVWATYTINLNFSAVPAQSKEVETLKQELAVERKEKTAWENRARSLEQLFDQAKPTTLPIQAPIPESKPDAAFVTPAPAAQPTVRATAATAATKPILATRRTVTKTATAPKVTARIYQAAPITGEWAKLLRDNPEKRPRRRQY